MTAAWAREGPYVSATAGDLHWWMYQHTDKLDEVRIALWEDGDELAGWSWLWLPDALVAHVAPERRAGPLYGEMLDWFEAEAAGADHFDAHVLDARTPAAHGAKPGLRARRRRVAGAPDARAGRPRSARRGRAGSRCGRCVYPPSSRPVSTRIEAHSRRPGSPAELCERRGHLRPIAATSTGSPWHRMADWPPSRWSGWTSATALPSSSPSAHIRTSPTRPRARCARRPWAPPAPPGRTGLVYAVTGNPSVHLYRSLGFRSVARHVVLRRSRRPTWALEPVYAGTTATLLFRRNERTRMATQVQTGTFEQEVLQSDKAVIVDFWAEWCGPATAVAPVLDRIADERQEELKLVKVNIDEGPIWPRATASRRFRP